MNDDEFLQAFETASLPSTAFHHTDHLRMAWLYLRRDGSERGEVAAVGGLRRFAAAKGVPQLYHDTLTRFWVRLVNHVDRAFPECKSFPEVLSIFPSLANKDLIYRHYDRATLASPGARQSWLDPDRLALPF